MKLPDKARPLQGRGEGNQLEQCTATVTNGAAVVKRDAISKHVRKSCLDRYKVQLLPIGQIKPSPENDEIYGTIDHCNDHGLIKSLNRERRHSSASVCACVDAETFVALGERRGGDRKSKDSKSKGQECPFDLGTPTTLIKQARSLLQDAPDLFALAKAGQGSVGEHFKVLKERRAESERLAFQMDEVLRYDPELHRKVGTGGMTIQEAVAEMEKRKAAEGQEVRERREAIERETGRLGDVVGVWSTIKGKRLEELSQLIAFDQYRGAFWKEQPFTLKSLRRTAEVFNQLAEQIEQRKESK
jgi:hypothetical protein